MDNRQKEKKKNLKNKPGPGWAVTQWVFPFEKKKSGSIKKSAKNQERAKKTRKKKNKKKT